MVLGEGNSTTFLLAGPMKEETRKEIEAKWLQLVAQASETDKTKTAPKTALSGVKVIRRRKGHMDVPITESA